MDRHYMYTPDLELASARTMFSEKVKELSVALAKVEALTKQLEELRLGQTQNSYHINTDIQPPRELDKMRQELLYRTRLATEQQTELDRKRRLLGQKRDEMSRIDRQIGDLQERLARKRQLNQQLAQQMQQAEVRRAAGIAAVEPMIRPQQQKQALIFNGNGVNKYQTLPPGTRFRPQVIDEPDRAAPKRHVTTITIGPESSVDEPELQSDWKRKPLLLSSDLDLSALEPPAATSPVKPEPAPSPQKIEPEKEKLPPPPEQPAEPKPEIRPEPAKVEPQEKVNHQPTPVEPPAPIEVNVVTEPPKSEVPTEVPVLESPAATKEPVVVGPEEELKSVGLVRGLKKRVSFDPLALLLDAALEGELDLVKKCAAQVEDPSAVKDEGITACHNAICAGHFDVVKFLVEIGCDINAADSDGWTPLHCASSCNNLEMAKFLVEHGGCIFATTFTDHETAAEKCEEDEDGYESCSQYLLSVQDGLGVLNGGTVFAVFSYEAQRDDELSFAEGDRLVVLRRGDDQEQDWWWARAAADGREGYVPRNLLGLFPRVPKKQQHQKATSENGSNSS